MKAKIITSLLFITLGIYLPCWGKYKLWWSPQILLISVACIILLFTQPPVKRSEIEKEKKHDRLSAVYIMAGSLLCIAVNIVVWANFQSPPQGLNWDGATFTGLAFLIGGVAFRVWAIQTLGKFFTSTVRIQHHQRIIQHGPYYYLRHPSYLGAYVAILGCSLLLHTTVGFILSASFMLAAYLYRIHVEEQTLVDEFGSDYRKYQEKTARLIPFLY